MSNYRFLKNGCVTGADSAVPGTRYKQGDMVNPETDDAVAHWYAELIAFFIDNGVIELVEDVDKADSENDDIEEGN